MIQNLLLLYTGKRYESNQLQSDFYHDLITDYSCKMTFELIMILITQHGIAK